MDVSTEMARSSVRHVQLFSYNVETMLMSRVLVFYLVSMMLFNFLVSYLQWCFGNSHTLFTFPRTSCERREGFDINEGLKWDRCRYLFTYSESVELGEVTVSEGCTSYGI